MTTLARERIAAALGSGIVPSWALLGRILIGVLFVVAGARKMMGWAGTVGYFTKLGLPVPELMTALAMGIELIAGAMLILGWHTRLAGWGLAIFTLAAALIGHQFWAADAAQFANQLNHFLKNIAIICGLLMVAASGPGSISADKR